MSTVEYANATVRVKPESTKRFGTVHFHADELVKQFSACKHFPSQEESVARLEVRHNLYIRT